jgi:hypothetical protein
VRDRLARVTGLRLLSALAAAAVGLTACGGDDLECTGPFCVIPPETPQPSTLTPDRDGQTGAPSRTLEFPVGVQVTDTGGRPVSGVEVEFAVSTGSGSIDSARVLSDIDGYARVNWTLGGEIGTQQLQASAEDTSGAPLQNSPLLLSATAQRLPPDHLVLRPTLSTTAQSGVPLELQPVVDVLDAQDQPVPDVQVAASVVSGGGTLAGTTTVSSNADGQVVFTDLALLGSQGEQVLQFNVVSNPTILVTSPPIQLAAGTPAALAAVGPVVFEGTINSPVTPGPSVVVRDAAGNGVPGVQVAFSPNRNADVSPETATTNEEGIAQVSWTLGTTANVEYSLTARVEASSIPPVRFTARARPGSAGGLRVAQQPSSPTQSGTAFARQPVIQVVDQQGNPTPQGGLTVTATISSGPTGSLQNQTATTDGSGRAAFSGLTLTGEVGSYTLSFSAQGLAGASSAPFAITTGSAARLAFVREPSTMARSRNPLVIQPIVQLQDVSGNPINQAGTQVVVTASPSGTLLEGETATTDANGRAEFNGLTITGIPGPKDLTFSASGMGSVSWRVTLPSVETVSTTSSHPASAVVGSVVRGPVVTWILRDASTRPVADADFILTATSGGTAAPLAPFSDINGAVQAGDWSLGGTAGYQYLELKLPDGRIFRDSIVATPDVADNLVMVSGNGQSAPPNSQLPELLVVRVVDRFGNGVPNVPVQWATCEDVPGDVINSDPNGYSGASQPTGSEPGTGFCTKASITVGPESRTVQFTYDVTAPAMESAELRSASSPNTRRSGLPPVAPRRSR